MQSQSHTPLTIQTYGNYGHIEYGNYDHIEPICSKPSFHRMAIAIVSILLIIAPVIMFLTHERYPPQADADNSNLYNIPPIVVYTPPSLEKVESTVNASQNLLRKLSTKKHHSINTTSLSGCESTILIIRHCEKIYSGDEGHCNFVGYQRAKYLTTLFTPSSSRWPVPSAIYATDPYRDDGRRTIYRQVETVTPLATAFNLTVQTYELADYKTLAADILKRISSGESCGQMTLISWEHFTIPYLAQALGCGPYEGCPLDYPAMEYDLAWEIVYFWDEIDGWGVSGSLQAEGFDPLSFAKSLGVYKEGKK